MENTTLAQLKDIHNPPLAMWPLAPGWYFLIFLMFVLGILAVYYYLQYRKIKRVREEALAVLADIKLKFEAQPDCHQALENTAMLMRRLVKTHPKLADKTILQGDPWLYFLENSTKVKGFYQYQELLLVGPYSKDIQGNVPAFFELIERWIPSFCWSLIQC